MSKIDYNELQNKIQHMQRWHKLYRFLKDELSLLGYWKNKSRGDPQKGFKTGLGKKRD